jgi:hypothetical protein
VKVRDVLIVLLALLTALSTGEVALTIASWIGLPSVQLALAGLVGTITFLAVLLFMYRE